MKRLVSSVCAVGAAAVFLLSPCAPVSAAETGGVPDFDIAVNAPPQVVFIGDSITAGYGLKDYSPDDKLKCESFANMLAKEFKAELPPEAEFSYYNEGLDGRTSGELLELLRSGDLDDKLKDADAVIVSIGGNDMLGTFLDVLSRNNAPMQTVSKAANLGRALDKDLEGFAENMPLIADELNARTDGQVFVQTLYNPMETTAVQIINKLSIEKIGKLNAIIRECSEDEKKYKICNVFDEFVGRSNELTNIGKLDIHPNAEGHKEIAKLIGKTIRKETYYYHDYAAEKKYLKKHNMELEELRKKQEQEKKERERRETIKKAAGTAAAGTGGIAVLSVLLIRYGKMKGG